MKKALITYFEIMRRSLRLILIIWGFLLTTWLMVKANNPELTAIDPTLPRIALGLFFTLIGPILHYLIKNKQ